MQHFNSTDSLIDALSTHTLEAYPGIIKNVNLSLDELEACAKWEEGGYTRNCLFRNESFELILLCWEPGAKTSVHDHGGENCWVYQANGTLEEVRYDHKNNRLIESNRLIMTPGYLSFMNDPMGYHTIENNSEYRAMSLHIYANPIDRCNVFNEDHDCFEIKELSYDYNVQSVKNKHLVIS